ncbi:hypothetical protein DER29_2061 [Micromonospora sp. M71_S20]|uniref:hypothetical protein n=1 Tax=Micromonospora sp. M71_S20 TaxID=592872 RepID=UPI000F1288B4|nr:hypothetical protein [Micromonospora sp. M71_S20]RLK24164.1 hypothetical protein DER29_2061 [Micromonospora sp. M71_S20]
MRSVRVPHSRILRALTVLAVVAAATGTAAGPAAAETDAGQVSGWFNDLTVGAAGAPGRTARLELSSTGATAPRVTVDLTGLAGVATASFPDWCVTEGTSVTCPMPPGATPDEYGTVNGTVPVVFRAAPGAVDGATGTLDYTVRADGLEPYTHQATVSVRSGPDLLDLVDERVQGVDVGDVHALPVAVVNAGDQPAGDLRLTLRFPVGLQPASYRNCRYGTDAVLATVVVCTVRGTFAPGIRHELRNGLATTVGPAALGDKRITQFVEPLATAGPLPDGVRLTRREADRALRLRPVGEPLDPIVTGDAYGSTYLPGIHGAFDVVAVAATVTGAVGDTLRVDVGIRNDGPGVPDNTVSGGNTSAMIFTPPAGVTVLATPPGCGPTQDGEGSAPTAWVCWQGTVFPAGQSFTIPFDLRIDGPTGAPGEVRVFHNYPRPDDDPTNDAAPVTLG